MEASWQNLQEDCPELAAFGKIRIDGKVAYLATQRDDGWPRVHPVTPIVGLGACFIFAEPESSKVRHLSANPKYSLHCGMSDSSGSSGEFKMTGNVALVDSAELRVQVEAVCSFRPSATNLLFELKLREVVSTTYRGGRPDRNRWSSRTRSRTR